MFADRVAWYYLRPSGVGEGGDVGTTYVKTDDKPVQREEGGGGCWCVCFKASVGVVLFQVKSVDFSFFNRYKQIVMKLQVLGLRWSRLMRYYQRSGRLRATVKQP